MLYVGADPEDSRLDDPTTSTEPGPAEILRRQLRRARGHPAKEHLLHVSLGHLLRDAGHYAEAARHYEAALAVASTGEERFAMQQLLGLVELHQGRLEQAKHRLEGAFTVADDRAGDTAVSMLKTLADVKKEMGHVDEALRLYDTAWKTAAASTTSDVDQLPLLAADVSEALLRGGELEKAAAWLRLASRQLEVNSGRTLGEDGIPRDTVVAAKIRSYQAALYHTRGRITQAAALYRGALRTQEHLLRPGHPDVLATRMGLARALRDLGDSVGALQAVEAMEATVHAGPGEGPDLSRILVLKSDLLREAQRYEDGLKAVTEAIQLQEATFGLGDHPEKAVGLSSYGSILHDQGKLTDAHTKYYKALSMNLRTVGANHPETAALYNSLGTLYQDAGDDAEAQSHFTKCLEIQLQTVGEANPDVSNTYNNLATVVFRRGDPAEAAQLLRKALKVLDIAGVPKGNPDREVYEGNLAEVLQALEQQSSTEPKAIPEA